MGIKRVASTFSPTFSDAVQVEGEGRWILVSGQVGTDDSGKIAPGDFSHEADQCFAHIRAALEKFDAKMSDVIRITAYITDLGLYSQYSEARRRAFPQSPPASATVQVAGLLLGARIEVDAMAFVVGPLTIGGGQ
jgi:2-iminobutanoate/2-iminopropanoate deaminase